MGRIYRFRLDVRPFTGRPRFRIPVGRFLNRLRLHSIDFRRAPLFWHDGLGVSPTRRRRRPLRTVSVDGRLMGRRGAAGLPTAMFPARVFLAPAFVSKTVKALNVAQGKDQNQRRYTCSYPPAFFCHWRFSMDDGTFLPSLCVLPPARKIFGCKRLPLRAVARVFCFLGGRHGCAFSTRFVFYHYHAP